MSDVGPALTRQIAILIDGAFFLRRIENMGLVGRQADVDVIAATMRRLCRRHVQMLIGAQERNWHRHVYRIFYYDAQPFAGVAHHPLHNIQIFYEKSPTALHRRALFDRLRQERNVALRLGDVIRHDDWIIPTNRLKPLLPTRDWLAALDLEQAAEDGSVTITLNADAAAKARQLQRRWSELRNDDVSLDLRQKGVDMRIGLDIAALALKRFVNTIILVTGDSDFVPAAKLARREGLQLILDPLWQPRKLDALHEHIDGLQSGLPKPQPKKTEEAA